MSTETEEFIRLFLVLDELAKKFAKNSIEKGLYDNEPAAVIVQDPKAVLDFVSKKLLMINGEVAEAHEELRNGHSLNEVYLNGNGKPEGFLPEMADVFIRTLEMIGGLAQFGLISHSFGEIVAAKHEYNTTRPKMHGGKKG